MALGLPPEGSRGGVDGRRDASAWYRPAALPSITTRIRGLVHQLAGRFWADIENHHPGITTLHLPDDVAQAWKERARVVTTADGQTRPSKDFHRLFMRVRAFYLDIQQWALEDRAGCRGRCPAQCAETILRDISRLGKDRGRDAPARPRERLPHLPLLADTADRVRAETAALLDTAQEHELGEVFDHAGGRELRGLAWRMGIAPLG